MYRNSTVGSLPLGLSRRLLAQCCGSLFALLLVLGGIALFGGTTLQAQQAGGIQGTISDPDGRPIAGATVTATNTDTGVQTSAKTGSAGTYSIQPLAAGPYNVEVVAKGFQRKLQENVTVDNASVLGLPVKMTVGSENTTVTVTDAPAMLDTTDATLGGTIENELYSSLPLSMNGGPRDPTAFQYLMPGVQENPNNNTGTGANNGNSGIYGGTGQTNLNENYLEGMPVTSISQQGSSNPISSAVSVDAVDQFSVATSGASAAFSGAGSTNYTIKSGGNQFHGTVFDFVRNTAFDTWGYFAKVPSSAGLAEKPGEHQNSYGGSLGGPILKDKLFFFGSYEGYHYTKISNTPQYITVPTDAERTGNFTDVLGTATANIVDPTTGAYGSRLPFQGLLNGVPTYNVIPTSELSSISTYLQAGLPQPTNLSTFNNYLASLPQANADYSIDARIDYTINQRNKFSLVGVAGNIGYGGEPFYSTQTQLPNPYAAGQYTNQKTASGVLSYVYIASQSLINSLRYLYSRNWGNGFSLTANKTDPLMPAPAAGCPPGNENACAAGINNLPAGNASNSMPAVTFSQGNGPITPYNWASTSSSGPRATNTYEALDELQWLKGRHNIKFGAMIEWLEANGGNYGGFSQTLSLQYSAYDTQYTTTNTGLNGDAYASYLVGAVYSSSVNTQSIQDVGGRFRQPAAYIQDNWQATPKLTLNLGLRYDYLQPYHEVKDRISFLNVNAINPIVGIPGVVEYAGFPNPANFPAVPANTGTGQPAESAAQVYAEYSPYICHCTTPVHPYNKNLEPQLGFAYAYTPSTVFAGAFSVHLSRAGGAGGTSSASTGTGNSGEFSATTSNGSTGSTGNPSFFLNPGLSSDPPNNTQQQGLQPINGNPIACGTGLACVLSAIPAWTVPGVSVNPLSSTGDYYFTTYFQNHGLNDSKNDYGCNTNDNLSCVPGAVNFADPYYGGRGPQFISYNFSVQRMINKKAVFTAAYSGSQTHFLPGGSGRGPATNSISPDTGQEYKGALTGGCSTGCTPPYPGFGGSSALVSQALRPFPQFGTMTDLWGSTGNAAYNSLQLSVIQRPWHNLSGLINYTRAKELDDTGHHRTQYPIGPQDGNFTRYYNANQIDRGIGANNQTNAINVTWVYSFPIGRGQAFFATNRIMGLIGGGWQLSGIYKYRDGYPLQVTQSPACMANSADLQGTCMPDYTPGFNKSQARINGRWGRGPGANAASLNQIQYLNNQAFECPDSTPTNITYTCGGVTEPNTTFKIGNIARSAPDGLYGPGWWDIDTGIRRTFNVRETATLHLTFQFEADVSNTTNSTFFNLSSSAWDSAAYGTVSGQNKSIQPRDWQFAGRFRF
jgi:hypothetical protein